MTVVSSARGQTAKKHDQVLSTTGKLPVTNAVLAYRSSEFQLVSTSKPVISLAEEVAVASTNQKSFGTNSRQTVAVSLEKRPMATGLLELPRGFWNARVTHLRLGWGLVSGGILSGAAAAWFAVQGATYNVPPSTPCATSSACASSLSGSPPRDEQRADAKLFSQAATGLGIALLATGGFVLLTTPPKPNTSYYARVGAGFHSSGGYVGFAGKW